MPPASSTITRLCNAALETATRYQNSDIGPDHLLYVVCSTEEGRREIESRNGDFRRILSFLKQSFMSRAERDPVHKPEFNLQFQTVVNKKEFRSAMRGEEDMSIKDVVAGLIEGSSECRVTKSAMIRGGLIDDTEGQMQARSFEDEVRHARRELEERHGQAHDQEVDDEDDDQPHGGAGVAEAADAVAEPASQDPQYLAAVRAMRNLSEAAMKDELDPVIGRDEEIARSVRILQRRRKGSIMLIGEPGVGKTAIAEGIAQFLITENAPEDLAERPVMEVSVSALLADTKYRGDFESRMRHLVDIASSKNAILFIDEAHTIMGAGKSSAGSVDAQNFLKPAMARGAIKVLAATTSEEARPIKKDKAFMRRFTLMNVVEPSVESSVEIIGRAEAEYATHHGVSYDAGVARRCVELAIRHIPDRRLPDKAFDVLDAAAVEAKAHGKKVVTEEFAILAIEAITGVNAGRPSLGDLKKIESMADVMKARVFGQDEAIDALSEAVSLSYTGVSDLGVAGAFLLNGPTGVGKTETAKSMASALGVPFVRLDMSEYMDAHSVSGLIGAPPGYVGFDEDGALVAAGEAHPRMVLLLDEIEKAHPKVFDILLQVLDNGRLTSSDGRAVSFRGAYVVMTGNIGANAAAKPAMGFGRTTNPEDVTKEAISGTFRKELRDRIHHIIQFKAISKDDGKKMIASEISSLRARMIDRGFTLEIDEAILDHLDGLEDGDITGRKTASLVNKRVASPLSKFIIANPTVDKIRVKSGKDGVKVEAMFP